MAGKITGLVFEHYHGDALAKLVFLALADRANEDWVCWPSRADICARTGAAPATVGRRLRALERDGWIARQARFQTSTKFRINVPRLVEMARLSDRVKPRPKGFDEFPEERAARLAAEAIENKDDDHCDRKDDHCDRKDDHLVDHLTVTNHSTNLSRAEAAAAGPSRRPPLKSGGGSGSVKVEDLNPLQCTLLRESKSFLAVGELLKPGSQRFEALRAALCEADRQSAEKGMVA